MQIAAASVIRKKAANKDKFYWREVIADWQKSNEHQKDYCARMNINVGTFAHWRGVFKKENKSQANNFFELKVTPSTQVIEKCIIECPTGHKIIFSSNLEEMKTMLRLLGLIT
jgi:hypothetical protein